MERNNLLVDEQNGFRKNRCTIEQISSLTSIVETRKNIKGLHTQLLSILEKRTI